MPRVPPQYPEAGINAIADSIRQRRGARGLTALDGTLLNAPEIAVSLAISSDCKYGHCFL